MMRSYRNLLSILFSSTLLIFAISTPIRAQTIPFEPPNDTMKNKERIDISPPNLKVDELDVKDQNEPAKAVSPKDNNDFLERHFGNPCDVLNLPECEKEINNLN